MQSNSVCLVHNFYSLKRPSTTMDILFGEFLLLYQFFFQPQVKRGVIFSNKHGIRELPHELPNYFRLKILGN